MLIMFKNVYSSEGDIPWSLAVPAECIASMDELSIKPGRINVRGAFKNGKEFDFTADGEIAQQVERVNMLASPA